jgi:hypothetical protein
VKYSFTVNLIGSVEASGRLSDEGPSFSKSVEAFDSLTTFIYLHSVSLLLNFLLCHQLNG